MLKVRPYFDDEYEVYDDSDFTESLFQGSLADCEAFIRLRVEDRI